MWVRVQDGSLVNLDHISQLVIIQNLCRIDGADDAYVLIALPPGKRKTRICLIAGPQYRCEQARDNVWQALSCGERTYDLQILYPLPDTAHVTESVPVRPCITFTVNALVDVQSKPYHVHCQGLASSRHETETEAIDEAENLAVTAYRSGKYQDVFVSRRGGPGYDQVRGPYVYSVKKMAEQ